MSSNQSPVLCFSNTEVSDVKRYCLVNFVWPFVKTDDDCVHWKNAKYGHQFCIRNTVEIKLYIIIYYIYQEHAHALQNDQKVN
jgi:hypothetical protein